MDFAIPLDQGLDLVFFAVGSDEENGAARVWLSGELDVAGAPILARELERLECDGRVVAVLDLSRLAFVDAVGLNALLEARSRSGNGRPPVLVGARPAVSRVFELVGLHHYLGDRS